MGSPTKSNVSDRRKRTNQHASQAQLPGRPVLARQLAEDVQRELQLLTRVRRRHA